MASVVLVSPSNKEITVSSVTAFVRLIDGYGYRPKTGTIDANRTTLLAGSPPPSPDPSELVRLGDLQRSDSDASVVLKAAFASVVAAADAGVNPLGDAVELAACLTRMNDGDVLLLGKGAYACPNGFPTLPVGKTISIVGRGGAYKTDGGAYPPRAATSIVVTSPTATGLTVTTPGFSGRDFLIVCDHATPTAGAGLSLTNANQYHLENVTTAGFYDGTVLNNTWFGSRINCHDFDVIRYHVRQTTTVAVYDDHSDSNWVGCIQSQIGRATDSQAQIRWEGGGGLRLVADKAVGQGQPGTAAAGITTGAALVGLDVAPADGLATVEINIIGGGFSNNKTANIRIAPTGTGTVSRVVIGAGTVLQAFGGTNTCVGVYIEGPATSNSNITNVSIADGTQFHGHGGGAIVARSMTGLTVGTCVWVPVAGTSFYNISGGTDTAGNNTRSLNLKMPVLGPLAGTLLDNVDLIRDARAILDTNGHNNGHIDYRYTRSVNLTSTSTWTTLFTIRPVPALGAAHSAGSVRVDCSLHDNGGSAAYLRQERSYYADNAGVPTVSTIGTDLALSGGTVRLALRWDTSVAGLIKLQGQLISPAAQVSGKATIEIRGWVGVFSIGDPAA